MYGFAKVRGYSFWPAKITGEAKGKIWVTFFGTSQLGSVTKNKQHWLDISETSLKKLVTNISMKNISFLNAVKDMVTQLKTKVADKSVLTQFSLIEKAYLSARVATGKEQHKPEGQVSVSTMAMDPDPQLGSTPDRLEHVVSGPEQGGCSMVGSEVEQGRVTDQGLNDNEGLSGQEGLAELTMDVQGAAINLKRRLSIQSEIRKPNQVALKEKLDKTVIEKRARKTLQDDQNELNKKFKEKIVKHDFGFTCKDCTFAAGMLLKAKTHASTCGTKKRKHAIKKKYNCAECEQTFEKKAALNKHFSGSHQNSVYKCSKCFATFKKRKTYNLHLKTHDTEFLNRFRCDKCTYKTRDNWCLQRHKRLKHSQDVSAPKNTAIVKEVIRQPVNATNSNVVIDDNDENEIEAVCVRYDDDHSEYDTEAEEITGGTVKDTEFEKVISEDDDEVIPEESQLIVNENVSPNIVDTPKPMCRWEEIRLSIMAERKQRMAEAGFSMEDLMEAKRDVHDDTKKIAHRARKPTKKTQQCKEEIRRSERVKCKEVTESEQTIEDVESVEVNTDETVTGGSTAPDIKIEIKIEIELCDELLDSNVDENNELSVNSVNEVTNSNEIMKELLEEVIDKIVGNPSAQRLRRYRCDKCKYAAIDNYHLKRHISSMHEDVQIQCLICDQIFNDKCNFKDHLPNCFFNCPHFGCKKKFKLVDKFNAHKRSHIKMLRRLV